MLGGHRHLGHVSVPRVSGGCGCGIRGGAGEEDRAQEEKEEKMGEDPPAVPRIRYFSNPGYATGRVRASHRPPLRVLMSEIAAHQTFSNNELIELAYNTILNRNREGNPPTKQEVLNVLCNKLQFHFFADTQEGSAQLTNLNGIFFTADLNNNNMRNFSMPLKVGMNFNNDQLRNGTVIDVTDTNARVRLSNHVSLTNSRFSIAKRNRLVTRPGVAASGTSILECNFRTETITLERAVNETKQQMEFVLHGNLEDAENSLEAIYSFIPRHYLMRSDARRFHVYLLLASIIQSLSWSDRVIDNLHRYQGINRYVRAIEDHVLLGPLRDIAYHYLTYNNMQFMAGSDLRTTPQQDQEALEALDDVTDLTSFIPERNPIPWRPSLENQLRDEIIRSSEQPFIVAKVIERRVSTPDGATSIRVVRGDMPALGTKFSYVYGNHKYFVTTKGIPDDKTLLTTYVVIEGDRYFVFSTLPVDGSAPRVSSDDRPTYDLFNTFSKAYNHYMRERDGAASVQDAVNFGLAMAYDWEDFVVQPI